MDCLTDLPAIAGTTHTTHCTIHHKILDQISEIVADIKATTSKADKTLTETTTEVEGTNKTTGMTRGVDSRTGMIATDSTTLDNQTKYQHHKKQPKAQVIFEYASQSPMELMQTIRNFITFMKANPTSREHFKINKLPNLNFSNEVNESEIYSISLDQVQQVINEDANLVFDALVAANYINKIECTEANNQ